MTAPLAIVPLGVPLVWLGMVLAISFVETPLKFRAPGITVPLGLGIGRLVFRVLNAAELALAAALTLVVVTSTTGRSTVAGVPATVLIALWSLLVVQVAVLRPAWTVAPASSSTGMHRRDRAFTSPTSPPNAPKSCSCPPSGSCSRCG